MSVSLLQIPQLRELEEKYARILGPGVLMERAGKAAAEFISDLYPAPARSDSGVRSGQQRRRRVPNSDRTFK